MEREGIKLILKGGKSDGSDVIDYNARQFCIPLVVKNEEGTIIDSITEVYYPDRENGIANYARTIRFADDPYVTPIDHTLFMALIEACPKGGTILEFGSGASTYHLSKYRNVISIENNAFFYGMFNSWRNYIACPITNGWYDINTLRHCLSDIRYDVVFVDGPDGHGRNENVAANLGLFKTHCDWFMDDFMNGDIQDGINALGKAIGRTLEIYKDCYKPWARIRRT